MQDETWQVDGINNPICRALTATPATSRRQVYSKYEWSLYHHENPMFGHFGHGFGVWFTPLGGVTDDTLCAFYGAGPQHQDLAIHQDALILNYFSRNHYGEPGYPIAAGYRRLYGPWLTFFTAGDADQPDAMINAATRTARAEITEHRAGADWVRDSMYPRRDERTMVTGRVRLTDGRPAADFHVILSTQTSAGRVPHRRPTYFARTDDDGRFQLPGIPPAWQPGTTQPGSYTLYVQPAEGSVTDLYTRIDVGVRGRRQHLGDINWSPTSHGTFLWQLGRSDRTSGEFALATLSPARPMPREYEKPGRIPRRPHVRRRHELGADRLVLRPDQSRHLDRPIPPSTAHTPGPRTSRSPRPCSNAAHRQLPSTPRPLAGVIPNNNDSTIARQADRSGYPRTAVLTFPAAR